MKTLNYILTFLFIIGFANYSSAKEVNLDKAKKVAINHYYEKFNQHIGDIDFAEIGIESIFAKTISDIPVFYTFDMSVGGFVIVSAEDAMIPIIGYAFEGSFPTVIDRKTNYGNFILGYADEIVFLRTQGKVANGSIQNSWKYLLLSSPEQLKSTKDEKNVEPMVSSLWAQGNPYNLMCPADPDGDGGHTVAGCGATSLSQILHYWRYPEIGTGSHSYYASGYGTQSANFGETYYNWTGMQNSIDPQNPFPIAELNYHAGVAIDMNYGPDGSGAQPDIVDDALHNYFRYEDAQYLEKENFNNITWMEMIQEELDLGQPVLYIGYTTGGAGHGFVCDGYIDTDFHFNFGWSGGSNGYYTLTDVNGFHVNQKCVIDIYPTDSDYPYYANGVNTIFELSGSLTDGSGPVLDYLNNSSVSWLIDPQTEQDSVSNITISFYQFATDENDNVIVYDGSNTSDAILGTFSGTELPETITSSGNKVLITFASDEAETAAGWYLEYNSNMAEYCQGVILLSEPSGYLSDGSGSFNYGNGSTCMWKIEPDWANEITLNFTAFATEENTDILKIYDGNALIAEFSGTELPESVVANSGSMFITFYSNNNTTFDGWDAYYEINNVGINIFEQKDSFILYPNPASDQLGFSYSDDQCDVFFVELITMQGNVIYSKTFVNDSQVMKGSIDLNNIRKGIYLFHLQSESGSMVQRVVIH